jgi:hypothetical protein
MKIFGQRYQTVIIFPWLIKPNNIPEAISARGGLTTGLEIEKNIWEKGGKNKFKAQQSVET